MHISPNFKGVITIDNYSLKNTFSKKKLTREFHTTKEQDQEIKNLTRTIVKQSGFEVISNENAYKFVNLINKITNANLKPVFEECAMVNQLDKSVTIAEMNRGKRNITIDVNYNA